MTPQMTPSSQSFCDRLKVLVEGALGDTAERCLAVLTAALLDSPIPEVTLVGLERFVRSVPNPRELLELLATAPRAVEVLLKLFAGSPYLTDILLREPTLLTQLTNPNSVGDLRSRQDFVEAALIAVELSPESHWAALRRFQQGELLRIGVCDFLGLLDLRSVTNQLSLLADALVQASLQLIVNDDDSSANGTTTAPGFLSDNADTGGLTPNGTYFSGAAQAARSQWSESVVESREEPDGSRRSATKVSAIGLTPPSSPICSQPLQDFAVLAFGKLGG